MATPLNINVYERGAAGVPSTAILVTDLKNRIESYQHSISDHYGFESCHVSLHVSADEAINWIQNGLMRSLIVSGPDAETVWEGFLETITVTMGQKKASLSLRSMANTVHMLWTTEQGWPGDTLIAATNASTLSLALYGKKLYLGSLPKIAAATVLNAGAKLLNAFALPRSAEPTDATTGALGEITLELSFAGWYAATEWDIVSKSSTANTATNTQLSATWLPAFATANAFLSTDYSGITMTGPLMSEYVAHYSTYKQVIDKLMSAGDNGNNPVAYGVYENRMFCAATSAAATPSTITYQEDAGSGIILDAYGNEVKPWDVRPNAMSQVVQLLDTGPPTGATDSAAVKYVARVTCNIQGDSIGCTLEPGGAGGLDALLAAFPPIFY